MTVAEAQRRISSREFAEWMAYHQIEPFGEERADFRMAILAALIANIHRDQKKRSKPYRPEDFLPHFGPVERPRQTPEQIRRMLRSSMLG